MIDMGGLLPPPYTDDLFGRLLALNNAHAADLSWKSPEDFALLLDTASHVRAETQGLALIVAMHEGCTYENPNFAWHARRFPHFYYIDRVVVSGAARGRGLARQLYADLEAVARAEGRQRLVCEINAEPPNPQSDAFHQKLGFEPVGEQFLESYGRTVRYWSRELS